MQVALELADLDPGWLFIFIPISNVSDVSLQKSFIVLGFATRLLRPMEMLALELSRAQFLFSKWTIYRWWSGDWPAGKDLPSGALYRVSGHVQQDSHVSWTLDALCGPEVRDERAQRSSEGPGDLWTLAAFKAQGSLATRAGPGCLHLL